MRYDPHQEPQRQRSDGSTRWTKVPPEIDQLAAELRRSGLGMERVADELNRRGIPSGSGGPWYGSAVRRAVIRHESRTDPAGKVPSSAPGRRRTKRCELTPEQRAMRAKIAASSRWAKEADRRAAMQAAQLAALERFAREVDPSNELAPAERARRAAHAQRAHMLRLALASSKRRRP